MSDHNDEKKKPNVLSSKNKTTKLLLFIIISKTNLTLYIDEKVVLKRKLYLRNSDR